MSVLAFALSLRSVVLSAVLATTPPAQLPGGSAPDPTPGPSVVAPVQAVLDTLIPAAMARYATPGAAMALVALGVPERIRGWGVEDARSGRPVDASITAFRVASVSKLVVATTAHVLAAGGRVSLDRPIAAIVPEFAPRFPLGTPTLDDLLTHSSGLADRHIGMFAESAADLRPLGEYLADRLPAQIARPGDRTSYSNHGFALVGYLLERAAGVPFHALVQSEVLDPLGMASSTFAQPLPNDLADRLASGHRCTENACEPLPPDYRQSYPAGGFVTTAPDMARFLRFHLGGLEAEGDAPGILDAAGLAEMHRLRFAHDAVVEAGMASGFFRHRAEGLPVLTHAGSSSGYHALVALFPEQGIGLFLVVNGGAPAVLGEALRAVARSLATRAASPEPRLPDPAVAAELVGSYQDTRGILSGVERFPGLFLFQERVDLDEDGWLVRLEGGETRRYGEVSPLLYREVDGDDYLAFRRDAEGRVAYLFAGASFGGSEFPAAYRRLAAIDEPGFVNEALSWTLMIPILTLLGLWPLLALTRWFRGRLPGASAAAATAPSPADHSAPAPSPAPGRTAGAAWVAFDLLAVGFAFGFAARLNRILGETPELVAYGMPDSLARFAYLAYPLVMVGAALPVLAVLLWTRSRWSTLSRLSFTIAAVSGSALLLLLARHGLFPPLW